MPAAHLHLYLFGLFRLTKDDQPIVGMDQARLQQLLAHLVSHRAVPISRQQLPLSFWLDSTAQLARKNLRTLLFWLRHALPTAASVLGVTSSTIQVRPDAPLTLDVAEFKAAALRSR